MAASIPLSGCLLAASLTLVLSFAGSYASQQAQVLPVNGPTLQVELGWRARRWCVPSCGVSSCSAIDTCVLVLSGPAINVDLQLAWRDTTGLWRRQRRAERIERGRPLGAHILHSARLSIRVHSRRRVDADTVATATPVQGVRFTAAVAARPAVARVARPPSATQPDFTRARPSCPQRIRLQGTLQPSEKSRQALDRAGCTPSGSGCAGASIPAEPAAKWGGEGAPSRWAGRAAAVSQLARGRSRGRASLLLAARPRRWPAFLPSTSIPSCSGSRLAGFGCCCSNCIPYASQAPSARTR